MFDFIPCCNSCYEYYRNRTIERIEYRREYKIKNREKELEYHRAYRERNRKYQYDAHIIDWKALKPFMGYRVPHYQHIKDYIRQTPKSVRDYNRLKARDISRAVARQTLKTLTEVPVEKTYRQLQKQKRNRKRRKAYPQEAAEYGRRYRALNYERVSRAAKERKKRERVEGDAALLLLKELGIEL